MSRQPRQPIRLVGSLTDLLFPMSEGNPGAIAAIIACFAKIDELHCSEENGGNTEANGKQALGDKVSLLLTLDDMNIRGDQIHIIYKYIYDFKVDLMLLGVGLRDPEMVKKLNAEMLRFPEDGTPIAVTSGASTGVRQKYDKPNGKLEDLANIGG